MSVHWKELLPVDQYVVTQQQSIDLFHLKTLSALYQPLIGPLACQLYSTLLFEGEKKDEKRSHYHLMLITATSLEVFFRERKKLEAMGLLSVYKKKEKDEACFVYELNRPLEPSEFFLDGVLNIYLFNRVGKTEYLRLKHQFESQGPVGKEDYEDVTASFNEVFTSIHPSELKSGHDEVDRFFTSQVEPKKDLGPNLSTEFDFSELFRQLSDVIISEKAFTEPVKEAIQQLAFVYQMTPVNMSDIIQQAFIHSGEIDIPTLRKAVRKHYTIENGDGLPSLSLRTETKQKEKTPEPETELDAQVRLFESMSPYDLLRNLANGAEPAQSDLRIVEGLLFDQKLPPGVVNVLLDYTMLIKDKKLEKNYIEKIASHWARKQITTVREAMEIARSEHKKYKTWGSQAPRSQSSTRSSKPYTPRVNTRQEVLPKWMQKKELNKDKDVEKKETETNNKKEYSEERAKRLEEYLRSL